MNTYHVNTGRCADNPCIDSCGACAGRCPTPALLALAPYAFVFTYLRSAAFLARALLALVGADARSRALLAMAPDAAMLAYLRSAAFMASALLALVGADARPQALLVLASLAAMLAYLRSSTFLVFGMASL